MIKDKKLHFMHIPKTGGMSLAAFLEQQFSAEEICPFHFLFYDESPWMRLKNVWTNLSGDKISKFNLFKGHLGWLPRMIFPTDEMETITFLRDPVERILSQYDFQKELSLSHNLNFFPCFDDFVQDANQGLSHCSNAHVSQFCTDLYYTKIASLMPPNEDGVIKQASHFRDMDIGFSEAQLLKLAIERLHSSAFVGIAEHYDASFEMLCMQYNWLPPRKVSKLNSSSRTTQRSDLGSKTLERVLELNQLDIALYEEAVRLFEDRSRVRVAFDRVAMEKKVCNDLPLSDEIQFSFADRIIGEGWHPREHSPTAVFCWNSSKVATLFFPIRMRGDLFVSFHIFKSLIPDFQEKLTLTVNAHPITLIHYSHPEGGYVFEGIIPGLALPEKSPLSELVFSLPEILRPCDVKGALERADKRALGFACQGIEVKPISSAFLTSRKELFEFRNQCTAVLQSRSWRITSPLRALAQQLRLLIHRIKMII